MGTRKVPAPGGRSGRKIQSAAKVAAHTGSAGRPGSWANWAICAALLSAVLTVYGQTAWFGFVNFDDPDNITRNPHVREGWKSDTVAWALTSRDAANWLPLTRLSQVLDVEIYGPEAGPPHLENALLHGLSAVFLFLFLLRASGSRWASAFVAAVFALHPLHVESVAWLSERKDVLCTVFWFLSLWAYVEWARHGRRWWYGLSLAAFCCGWMAKPMIVTLPLVLLIVDAWPLGRLRPLWPRLREKLPFFAVSAAGSFFVYGVQKASGAVRTLEVFPLGLRVENAAWSYVVYLAKTVWPSRLSVFYPYPQTIPVWETGLGVALLVAIPLLTARTGATRSYLAAGWWWFVVTLLPVIGLVQAGAQARADRYMYVPMVGLSVMLAWGVRDGAQALPRRQIAAGVAAAVALLALGGAAWAQTRYWQNSGTLFEHALEVTGPNYLAEHDLGDYLIEQSSGLAAGLAHLQRAVELNPDSARARTDLANALSRVPGREVEAIAEYRAAIQLDADAAIPHNDLANTLANTGQVQQAIAEYQTALRLDPNYADAQANLQKVESATNPAQNHYNSGMTLLHEGRPAEAVPDFEAALHLNPNDADAENNLGVALTQIPGREREAVAHFRAAVRLRPDDFDAHCNLGVALANTPGGTRAAIAEFESALKLREDPQVHAMLERLRSGQWL